MQQHSHSLSSTFVAPQQKWILFLHFLICSLGLTKLAMIFASGLYEAQFLELGVSKLGIIGFERGIDKLGRFLQYSFGLTSLVLFYGVARWLLSRLTAPKSQSANRPLLLLYFLINIFFTACLWRAHALFYVLPGWLLLTFALPLKLTHFSFSQIPPLSKKWGWFFTIAIVVQLCALFQPLIFKPMRLGNEFIDLPGQTQLASGQWVDNTTFINQHNLGGILKYDPRQHQGQTPTSEKKYYVPLKDARLLQVFLDANVMDAKNRYTYYPHLKRLTIKGPMSAEEHQALKYAFPLIEDQKQIDKLYLFSLKEKDFHVNRTYTPIEWDFIQKNKIELRDQVRIGWFLYHHNYFFSPIFSMTHSDGSFSPVMIYGWFTTVLFAKLLPVLGGVNYQTYFKLLFSFYPLYYLSFLVVLLCLFKRVEYVLLGLLLGITGLFELGTQLIQLGVGLNPLRHFLDLFALLAFYFYVVQRRLLWLATSLLLALVMLLLNKEFGLFLLAAISLAVILQTFTAFRREGRSLWHNVRAMLFVCISGLIGLYVYFMALPGQNPLGAYMLFGEGTPSTSQKLVAILLIANSLLYATFLLFRRIQNPINDFWAALIFYCQFIFIYYLWFPAAHHFIAISVPLILLGLCFIFLSIRYFKLEKIESSLLCGMIGIVFALAYLPSALHFYSDQHQYEKNFQSHRLYQWPFPTAQVVSTIDPQLFEHAVALIDRYIPKTQSKIYLLSKYESILPILANKYNAWPFPELMTSLITKNDVDALVNLLAKQKPLYIFVDTDIERSFNNEVYDPNDILSKQFELFDDSRLKVLGRLTAVYQGIQQDYKPIAKSELITVYQRVNHLL